jgi:epoxyqueuosine reductase
VLLRNARLKLDPVLGPVGRLCLDPKTLVYFGCLPELPERFIRRKLPPVWDDPKTYTPDRLRGVVGVRRSPEAEEDVFSRQPLHYYFSLYPENLPTIQKHFWPFVLHSAPRLAHATRHAAGLRAATVRGVSATSPSADGKLEADGKLDGLRISAPNPPPAASLTSDELTDQIRAEARRLGLSAVGFAPYDRKYTLEEYKGTHDEGSVIACLFEQDWAGTQTAPSARAERAAFSGYAELMKRATALAQFVEQQGAYRAHPHPLAGETVVIPYGVEAGLGQLGLNGQLLTPAAGSRARMTIITTNTELVHGSPTDFGIEAICDACQACVRRCPVGAIPNSRKEYRGVTKAKIKTDRCFPVVTSADGCAVCMKVCPIQRYGLNAVRDHWSKTDGEILGRDTDELEGFTWPLDGRYYGVGKKPAGESRRRALNPPHWIPIDPTRTSPPSKPLDHVT